MSFAEERGTNFLGFARVVLLQVHQGHTEPSGIDCSEEATLQVQVDAFSKALLHLITFVYHATN